MMMSVSKPPTFSAFFFVLIFLSFILSYCIVTSSIIVCPENEKQALLTFKQSLSYPDYVLSSWNGEVNCCEWEGVSCSNLTSHVLQLHLQRRDLIGKINPSLLNLKHLKYLDLSQNDFEETIPSFIGSLTSLEYLNLSYAGFHGKIPHNIGNLSNLHTLCFGVANVGSMLNVDSLEWLWGLSKLEHLNMDGVNLSKAADKWPQQVINKLPSLVELHFSDCSLDNNFSAPLNYDVNITHSSLAVLDLSWNKLNSSIPEWLYSCTHLQFINLGRNNLEGKISNSIANLTSLNTLHLSYNQLEGVIPNNIWNSSSLQYLDLENNKLSGNLPNNIGNLSSLQYLDLGNNKLSGNLPNNIGNLSSLQYLELGNNKLSGNLPESVGKLFNLPRVGDNVIELDLSNNSFSGGISHFLCHTTANETYTNYLEILHLGENQLSEELPDDCWMKWPSLRVLNLGNNNFSGRIPNSIGLLTNLESLNLYGNKFSGRIPSSIQNCTQLVKMDLSDNNLDGSIPIGASFSELRILILRSNKLSGEITPSICKLTSLQILDLSANKFSGAIPRCVNNFTAMATKRSASIASKGSAIPYDTILPWVYILRLVNSIDLSNNNLSGHIPKEITSLVELISLNLSGNHFTGLVPDAIGSLKQLESLDFSRNSLSRQIPSSFASISSLIYLNLSCNNLTGRIPEGTQLSGFNESSFIGNNLCGPPLTISCSDDPLAPAQVEDQDQEDDKPEIEYVFVSLGYAVGLSGVLFTLYVKKSWMDACYELLEDMWDIVYVYFYIRWRRLRTSFGPN